jgi:excinuclease ABC subunit A
MRMDKPEVDHISGLCPAVAIEQKVITRTPRSTVGSMTEIYDYLRLLFARIGKTISPISGKEVKKDDIQDVFNFMKSCKAGDRLYILSGFEINPNRSLHEELGILMQKGFSRLFNNKTKETLQIEDLLQDVANDS